MTDDDRIRARVEAMLAEWPNLEDGLAGLVARLERVEALAKGPVTCQRCGHDVDRHWPNTSQQSTTACVPCLESQETTRWGDRTGICDHTAQSVWRADLRAALADPAGQREGEA